MAYIYLLDLHKQINQRIESAKELIDNAAMQDDKFFHQGRVLVLTEFKEFLTEKMNPKLPRRIRKKKL